MIVKNDLRSQLTLETVLLQNALKKYYKLRQLYLLQIAANIYYKTRQPHYYKTRQIYYKTRQVLQNASILLQNAAGITKCVDYYKTRHNKRDDISRLIPIFCLITRVSR